MIHSKRIWPAFVLAAILYLFPCPRAAATITVISDWRLGESEPTAIAGTPAVTTLDYIGLRKLTFQGAATYSSDVGYPAALRVGSMLSVNFTNGAYATNTIVSTAVNNFGIEGWVKPTSTNDAILFYNGDTATSGWGIIIGSGGHYNGLYGGVQVIDGPPIDIGVWTHVALVCSNGTSFLYVHASLATVDASAPSTPTGNFALACAPQVPGAQAFTGLIDEVRVFTFASGQFNASDLLANFPVAPVTPLPPTQITSTTATLNGAVFPRGVDTTGWLEWGLTAGYGNSNSPVPLGNGTSSVAINNAITGLQPGHTYHYRAVAANSSGVMRSWDQTFVTPVINITGGTNQTTYARVPFTNPVAMLTANPLALSANDGPNGMVLKADGTVSVWGDNSVNQTNVAATLSNIVGIASANYHFDALKRDGTIIAWGLNTIGQTILPPNLDNVVLIAGGGDYSMALRRDGTVTSWGPGLPFSSPLTNIIQISASLNNAVALTADGKILFNGAVPPSATNVVAVSSGAFHVMALRADGNVVVWGGNNVGQTNIPPGVTNVAAISACGDGCMALMRDGSVIAWGSNDGQKHCAPGVTNIVGIAAAGGANFAVRADGAVFGWGSAAGNQTTVPDGLTNITGVINVSGSVNTNAPGVNTLTYTTTSFLNAINSATVSVTVLSPSLTLTPLALKTATLSWPSNATGYILQQTALINSNGWTAAPSGATNPVIIPTTNSALFYRLIHP